jgi:hypothetical protein
VKSLAQGTQMNKKLLGDFLAPCVFQAKPDNSSVDQMLEYMQLQRLNAGLDTHHIRREFINDKKKNHDANTFTNLLKAYGAVIKQNHGNSYAAYIHDNNNECAAAVVYVLVYPYSCTFNIYGDLTLVTRLEKDFSELLYVPGTNITTVSEIDKGTKGSMSLETSFISKHSSRLGRDCFYPFIKVGLEKYFDEYMKSQANVLVLIGPPGTGKSTFLRTLMVLKSTHAMLAYDRDVIQKPKLLSYFRSSENTILGLEDVDVFLEDRTRGNELMSRFLNNTEGVVHDDEAVNKKVVFSTNLSSIHKVDPALLRRGRCFDVIEFRLLNVAEAREIEIHLDLPEQDFNAKDLWSLAEILNPPQPFMQMSERMRQGIGFNG